MCLASNLLFEIHETASKCIQCPVQHNRIYCAYICLSWSSWLHLATHLSPICEHRNKPQYTTLNTKLTLNKYICCIVLGLWSQHEIIFYPWVWTLPFTCKSVWCPLILCAEIFSITLKCKTEAFTSAVLYTLSTQITRITRQDVWFLREAEKKQRLEKAIKLSDKLKNIHYTLQSQVCNYYEVETFFVLQFMRKVHWENHTCLTPGWDVPAARRCSHNTLWWLRCSSILVIMLCQKRKKQVM